MILKEQIEFIEEYVNEQFFDRKKLMKYLEMHEIVGNEIFSYVDRKKNVKGNRIEGYSQWLEDEAGYIPISKEKFFKRIPFYFYVWDGDLDSGCGDLGYILYATYSKRKSKEISLEDVYEALEYLFYDRRLKLQDIFNYMIDQTGVVTQEYFMEWVHYLHLCEKLNWNDMMPERFITAYNMALEASNLEPIIYDIYDIGNGDLYIRDGIDIIIEGVFPCDEKGIPIMRWIGLKILHGGEIKKCTCEKSKSGYITIKLTPNSVIHYLDKNKDGEKQWFQLYAGPQHMEFDYTILKYQREYLHMTQQQVAEAVGANIRTYQKWERGETQPDGYYLLRLLNWLDISDIQLAVKYRNIE